jgi:predicted DsbA family dithiol-disulfide isomerase
MHDELASSHERGDEETDLQELAAEVGLDAERFVHDVETGAQLSRVEDDNLDAEAAGLPARPQLYLNGRRFDGPANSLRITAVLQHSLAARSKGS